jgi:hypothetical protein
MNLTGGIIEIDLHGCTYDEGLKKTEKAVNSANNSVYRIRVIHGFHGGNSLKRMLQEEFSYGRSEKVLRVVGGSNQGITELILREF